jgi:hypothetical protein
VNKEAVAASWLKLLKSWQALALMSAEHIANCDICIAAGLNQGSYCRTGDIAWEELKAMELRVTAILPELRAAGIDVDQAIQLIADGAAIK